MCVDPEKRPQNVSFLGLRQRLQQKLQVVVQLDHPPQVACKYKTLIRFKTGKHKTFCVLSVPFALQTKVSSNLARVCPQKLN